MPEIKEVRLTPWEEESEKLAEESRDEFPPSLKIPEGTTVLGVSSDDVKEITEKKFNKVRKIMTVCVYDKLTGEPVKGTDGKTLLYSWWVNPASPLWREIVTIGKQRKTLVGAKLEVTRIGSGMKDTRYAIKLLA